MSCSFLLGPKIDLATRNAFEKVFVLMWFSTDGNTRLVHAFVPCVSHKVNGNSLQNGWAYLASIVSSVRPVLKSKMDRYHFFSSQCFL